MTIVSETTIAGCCKIENIHILKQEMKIHKVSLYNYLLENIEVLRTKQ